MAAIYVLNTIIPFSDVPECPVAAQKQDAKDTFGHGSTVEWGFYIGEIIISIGGYIKTRNPMLFVGGLAFLIVITRTFFALAG
ncbi:protein TraE [Pantoea agglomerans]|uniref:protein TraE n=1 Tax=Enterobacter agglomerans TaxID=549 RepID=UPI003C7D8FDC